ncbi:hypothetical protein Pmar_PMAR020777 [Perkinsus marinus ATCC 50983]|uniref:Uncharacterized protein n=1 Tax=Perkinsus marinus (strain ATCC 50983 / TXsc) TaxID=423536 RepID=C5KQU0_PERM5|nr:hypothetical protein Pmar_PMAR020777 [Perkinsus marinus ATCC 50983]EER13186.1 hypothetical protein Pmar_PMAR020777 [Perkinsus marinus ATCC 50983]|eukprot:XP_002781391.1 hypothetical protein Pmar_PMAR020777 [Perkinsus marinus ATCC 50983]
MRVRESISNIVVDDDNDIPEALETLEVQESLLQDQLRRVEVDIAKLEEDSLLVLRTLAPASVRSRASSSATSSHHPVISVSLNGDEGADNGETGDGNMSMAPLGEDKVTETVMEPVTLGMTSGGVDYRKLPVRQHSEGGGKDRSGTRVNNVQCRPSIRFPESQLMEHEETRNCQTCVKQSLWKRALGNL